MPDDEILATPEARAAFRDTLERENAQVIAWLRDQADRLRVKP